MKNWKEPTRQEAENLGVQTAKTLGAQSIAKAPVMQQLELLCMQILVFWGVLTRNNGP